MFRFTGHFTAVTAVRWSREPRAAPGPRPPVPDPAAVPAGTSTAFDIAQFPAGRQGLRHVAVFAPGGSQGGAVAAQALRNAAGGGFSVLAVPRDPAALEAGGTVRCGAQVVDVARHPAVRVVATLPADLDPADTLVIDPTVNGALDTTIGQTPPGSRVVYLQNGVPSHVAHKQARGIEPHTLISLVAAARTPEKGVTVTPGGTMLAGENDTLIDTLHRVLQDAGFFRLRTVPDIEAARYEKIALNCALNVTATLFGSTLGELRILMARDPRCGRLIGGLAGEVCAVARAQGIGVKPADRVFDDIRAAMEKFPRHPTSMRAAFEAGLPTEIEVLNAAIVREGARQGIPVPLNQLACAKLALFEAFRGAEAGAAGFHRRHPVLVADTVAALLQAAGRLA